MIWASQHALTQILPTDWQDWSDERLHSFLEENAWQPFEYHPAKDILEHISSMAHSVRSLF